MKHLRLYEDIKWEFDDEEDDITVPKFKIGDIVWINDHIDWSTYWDSRHNKWETYCISSIFPSVKIIDIRKGSDIVGDNERSISGIDYDGWMWMSDKHWPWFKYEEDKMDIKKNSKNRER